MVVIKSEPEAAFLKKSNPGQLVSRDILLRDAKNSIWLCENPPISIARLQTNANAQGCK